MTREILIRDLTRCVVCDVCLTACEKRHGRARMSLEGPRFGKYQLPDVCRNCPDTPCVNACRLEGMRSHEGRTYVTDACKGCNKCVEACPFGAVKLLPRQQRRDGFFARILGLARIWGGEREKPVVTGRVTADASRCVQCGVCGYNCPVGIQVRDFAREGRPVDDERCITCGLCIAVCPRGTLRWDTRPHVPASRFRADKCDLCSGYAQSACVKECPTQALYRLPTDRRLLDLNEQLYYEAVGRYFETPGNGRAERDSRGGADWHNPTPAAGPVPGHAPSIVEGTAEGLRRTRSNGAGARRAALREYSGDTEKV